MEVLSLPSLGEPSGKTKLEIGGNTEVRLSTLKLSATAWA